MKADSGISEAVTRAYGFNWNFGKWERQLNSNQENVMDGKYGCISNWNGFNIETNAKR